MSVTTRTLIDTNEPVHRYDRRFPDRQRIATEVLYDGIASGSVRMTHQSIVEFIAATTRVVLKSRWLDAAAARLEAEEFMAKFPILYLDASGLRTALHGGMACRDSICICGPTPRSVEWRNNPPRTFGMAACTARWWYETPSSLFRRPHEAPSRGRPSSPSRRPPGTPVKPAPACSADARWRCPYPGCCVEDRNPGDRGMTSVVR